MERILVGMDPERNSFWAGIHALSLAKRINAKVSFVRFIEPETVNGKNKDGAEQEALVMKHLKTLIEQGRAEGIGVDSFVIHGAYDKELVRFIWENKITMLVVGLPSNPKGSTMRFADLVEKVRHRIGCRIEVVNQKKTQTSH